MPYYIRVLGTQDPDIHLDELYTALEADGLTAEFSYAEGERPDKWTILDVHNENGDPLVQIERSSAGVDELCEVELNEFRENIQDDKPATAVKWLAAYFDKVTVIYAFQMLKAAFDDTNYEIVTSIKTEIWNRVAGILQADNEGFSNEEGYHILWQFVDNVTGNWNCAVINEHGNWEKFIMNIGDKTQRQEFRDGKVPNSSTRI